MPVVIPPSATQLVVGAAAVPQQVPRAVRVAPPFEVTFAPKVAVVLVMRVAVGEVTVGKAALIAIEVMSVSVPASLVAVTVTEPPNVPAALGVPVIRPPEVMDKLVGNPAADQVLPPPPPLAVIWKLYGTPTVPPVALGLLLITGAALTVKLLVAVLVPEGVVTVTLLVPTVAAGPTVMLAVIDVDGAAPFTVNEFTVIPAPKDTEVAPVNSVPLMDMLWPTAPCPLLAGVTRVTVGGLPGQVKLAGVIVMASTHAALTLAAVVPLRNSRL